MENSIASAFREDCVLGVNAASDGIPESDFRFVGFYLRVSPTGVKRCEYPAPSAMLPLLEWEHNDNFKNKLITERQAMLRQLGDHARNMRSADTSSVSALLRHAADATQFIVDYLSGDRPARVPITDPQGTEFQAQVWKEISAIPRGSVLTYGQIAAKIGNPQAVRAVGGACGKNPVGFIIPCHRVVAASGKIGGFSGGDGIKARLLRYEGAPGF